MKTYLVGGAVRDILMGLEPKDRDYVVVGETHESMLAKGFKQVGADFPVYLHPNTKEEYALARTERKVGQGYKGFDVKTYGVTLEEDLRRRDLTINAMAQDEDGTIIDPFGGRKHLEDGVLSFVDASTFVEDPLRVLRVARFAARYDFKISAATGHLMNTMLHSGELEHLTPERVTLEMIKALGEKHPAVFFERLRDVGALNVILPELAALDGVPQPMKHHPEIDTFKHVMMSLEQCCKLTDDPVTRFAVLVHDLGKGITPKDQLPQHIDHEKTGIPLIETLCDRLKISNVYRQAGIDACQYHLKVHRIFEARAPGKIVKMFLDLGLPKHTDRINRLLIAAESDARGRLGFEDRKYPQPDAFRKLMSAFIDFDTRPLALEALEKGTSGPNIGNIIMNARCHLLKKELKDISSNIHDN